MLLTSFEGLLASDSAKPPLQLAPDTLLFSFIIFGVLLAVLYKFAWGPIVEGLELREKKMADDIEEARAAKERAQAQLADYEAKIAGAEAEASALIAEAKADAITAKEKIMADASEEAQRTKDRALADIEAAKNAAVRDLAESSVDSAVSLAGSIVGRSLDKKDHKDLIEKSISQFNAG
ncbi:F0F1 ATP synthase subunit B [Mariniblastus sp.]|nr:F0F1 ATP synthase subunit B [Mariniblastus sp.]